MDEAEAPWRASLAVAPTETVAAVERSLREVMLATRTLRRVEINSSLLPAGSRARRHLEALLSAGLLFHRVDNRIEAIRVGAAALVRDALRLIQLLTDRIN